jgi:hypothetical protein
MEAVTALILLRTRYGYPTDPIISCLGHRPLLCSCSLSTFLRLFPTMYVIHSIWYNTYCCILHSFLHSTYNRGQGTSLHNSSKSAPMSATRTKRDDWDLSAYSCSLHAKECCDESMTWFCSGDRRPYRWDYSLDESGRRSNAKRYSNESENVSVRFSTLLWRSSWWCPK